MIIYKIKTNRYTSIGNTNYYCLNYEFYFLNKYLTILVYYYIQNVMLLNYIISILN